MLENSRAGIQTQALWPQICHSEQLICIHKEVRVSVGAGVQVLVGIR